MNRRIVLVALLMSAPACVPVLVGGLILKSSKSNEQKREFMTWLQRTNLEREQAGLKPLDVCSEKYKFDAGWAAEEPNCLERIKKYQGGDLSALDMGDYKQPADTIAPQPPL